MVSNKADKSRKILLILAEKLFWKTSEGGLGRVAGPGARLEGFKERVLNLCFHVLINDISRNVFQLKKM